MTPGRYYVLEIILCFLSLAVVKIMSAMSKCGKAYRDWVGFKPHTPWLQIMAYSAVVIKG